MPADDAPGSATTQTLPYGAWPSPISAATAAAAGLRLESVRFVAGAPWWTESRPAEGGRSVVVSEAGDVLPAGWNARTRVHEYGGGAWLFDATGGLVFSQFDDQRLYRVAAGEVVPLTPAPEVSAGLRYADGILSPDGQEVWCVREEHAAGRVRRALVAVPLDGRAASEPSQVRLLGGTTHFLSGLRSSPDGRRVAWLGWDHPDMPWDSTRLFVADVGADQALEPARLVAGGPGESLVQPEWVDDDTLRVASDRSGWWNLYECPAVGGGLRPLCRRDEEFGFPAWTFGNSASAQLADGRLAVLHGRGRLALGVLDPTTGQLEDLDLPFTSTVFCHLDVDGQRLVLIAGAPEMAPAIAVVDVEPGGLGVRHRIVRSSAEDALPDGVIPQPVLREIPGPDGRVIYCYDYAPRNDGVGAPDGERPPYVLTVHGGPTGHSDISLDLGTVFFTSRGIGVADVQYSGSSGFGREYRERLRGQWGVAEVEDCVAVAEYLGRSGLADADRIGIRGGSAGGWTVLACLTRTTSFAAGASYYGVADALALAADTHDFESRYLDGLIGPLPEAIGLYRERSPLSHLDGLSCPVLLLQGLEDPVVPPAQAEAFVEALRERGLPYAYVAFEGESHGFRRAETREAALQAELSFYGQVFGFLPPGVPHLVLEGGQGNPPADASAGDFGGS